jgi:hypothetical protein
MKHCTPIFPLSAILAVGFFFLMRFPLHSEQAQEYLSDAEIDQLRTEEAKEPPERIRLLSSFLKIRFERAKSAKSGVPYQEKDAKQKTSPDKDKKKAEGPEAKNSSGAVPLKSFKGWMEDYLKCLDEISNNIEDFSTLRYAEPKPYQKSLKNLRASLEEQQQWIVDVQNKVEKGEKVVIDDVLETVQDLLGDITNSIDELNQQIEQMKDSRKP